MPTTNKIVDESQIQIINNVSRNVTAIDQSGLNSESMIVQENIPEYDSYFCSELVAAAYQSMGLLGRELPASDYWPRSFESLKDGKRRLEFL